MTEVAKPPIAGTKSGLTNPFEGFGEETINAAAGIVANSLTPATEPPVHPDLFNRDQEKPTELIKLPEPEKHTDAKQKVNFLRPRRKLQPPIGINTRKNQQHLTRIRSELQTMQTKTPSIPTKAA